MNKIYKVVFSFINSIFMLLIVVTLFSSDVHFKTLLVNNINQEKQVHSNQLLHNEVVVHVQEVRKKDSVKKKVLVVDKSQVPKEKEDVSSKKIEEKKNQSSKDIPLITKPNEDKGVITEKIEKYTVLESFNGKLSAYGPDCNGCSNQTSSGYDIRDSIYYNDKTYGTIRILAGDKKYPYGTIVNLKIDSKTEMKGIVLDRGGNIGINKKFQFDLLCTNQKEAYIFGTRTNVTFEILRLGY